MINYMLYHPEYAPDGRAFAAGSDDERNSQASGLMREGWYDNPAKFGGGRSAWGPEGAEGIARLQSQFEQGSIPAIERVGPVNMEQVEQEQAAANAVRDAIKERDEGIRTKQSLKQEMSERDDMIKQGLHQQGVPEKDTGKVTSSANTKKKKKPVPVDESTDL